MKNFFDNTEIAFKLKSDSELERAYFLFKMIAHQPLVRIGTAVTHFAIKAHLPVEGLIRATVFDHFCGGVSELDCMKTVDAIHTAGVCSVLDYSVEGKETEEEFEELLDFLREAQLDRVGAFAYSPVEGARANDLPDPVPEDIKQERLARFMEVQGEISAARLKARIGNEYQVVIDSVDAEGAVGRTYADAPEVDGLVHLNGVYDVKPGDRVWAEVIHANEHDVWAVLSEDQDDEEAHATEGAE